MPAAITATPDERLAVFVDSWLVHGFCEANKNFLDGLTWQVDEQHVSAAAVIDSVVKLRESAGRHVDVNWLCRRFLDQDSPLNLVGPHALYANLLFHWDYTYDSLVADLIRAAVPCGGQVLAAAMLCTGDAKAASYENGTDDDVGSIWCAQLRQTLAWRDILDPHPGALDVFVTSISDDDAFAWSDLTRFAAAAADLCATTGR